MSQVYCVFDYETYSEADLKEIGAYEYSAHPSTDILCAAWRTGTREELPAAKTQFWDPSERTEGSSLSGLYSALMDPNVILVAHNAFFEQCITRNVFATKYMYSKKAALQSLGPERWLCTAALAAALAMPRKLEKAALALKLPVQKDMGGRALMLKWCKPRRVSKSNPKRRHDDPAELKRLIDYCVTDVDTQVELFLRVPPLAPFERKVWEVDQKINMRGFQVDRPVIQKVLDMIDLEVEELNRETLELTGGEVETVNRVAAVRAWLRDRCDFEVDSLAKDVLAEVLAGDIPSPEARRLLEIRAQLSKTSNAKYGKFKLHSETDGRCRDGFLYHGASTGRWAAGGTQPHNFPRGTFKNLDIDLAAKTLSTGDLEWVRFLYQDPSAFFSSCLRGMIVAPKGRVLDVADYSTIEPRVLFWLAGHDDGLQAFRDGRDLYREIAADIYRIPLEQIKSPSAERDLGKTTILGCGYQMGAKRFAESCAERGQPISADLAEVAVKAYRKTHSPVVKLWDSYQRAAVAAVQQPGKAFALNRTRWYVRNGFLWCDLPSGRRLAYAEPDVTHELTAWGDKRPVLHHWSENPKTRQWERANTYGGKLVENVVQAVARDLLAAALLRIEADGAWAVVSHVHDEIVAERDLAAVGADLSQFIELMVELPDWADGLPVKAEGWSGARYRK